MDANLGKRGKCENNQSKVQTKHSPITKPKLKRGKCEKGIQKFPSTNKQELRSEDIFKNKDTLVPVHLSNQELKQTPLYLYEQKTGIDKLPKITDIKGNDYYILDINPATD